MMTEQDTTAEELAARLPLLPDEQQRELAALIDWICRLSNTEKRGLTAPSLTLGNDNTLSIAKRGQAPIRLQREMDAAVHPVTPVSAYESYALVLYAQHVWESRSDDLEAIVALSLGQDNNPSAVLNKLLTAVSTAGTDYDIPGPGWAAEPKRAIGLILNVMMRDSFEAAFGNIPDEVAFWQSPQGDVPQNRFYGQITEVLSQNPDSDWRQIARLPFVARKLVNAWFSMRYRIDYELDQTQDLSVAEADDALDRAERLLLPAVGPRSHPPTARMWSSLRSLLIWWGVIGIACMGLFIFVGVTNMWHIFSDMVIAALQNGQLYNMILWLVGGIASTIGWLAIIGIACAWMGINNTDPQDDSAATRWLRRLTTAMLCVIVFFLITVGPNLPDLWIQPGGSASWVADWPSATNMFNFVLRLLLSYASVVLAFNVGSNPASKWMVGRLLRRPKADSILEPVDLIWHARLLLDKALMITGTTKSMMQARIVRLTDIALASGRVRA